MKKNFLKLKIENIAQKLINTNQSYSNDQKEETNVNQLSSDESTIKDSLSEFEEISKSIKHSSHKNQRNKNNILAKNYKFANILNDRQHSSLCTKMTSLTEHNTINGTFENNIYNTNIDVNKQNFMKFKNIENNKKNFDNKGNGEINEQNEIIEIKN